MNPINRMIFSQTSKIKYKVKKMISQLKFKI